jgi:hypothetical protein
MKRTAWVGAMIAFVLSQQAVPSAFAIGEGQRCGGYFQNECNAGLVCDLDFREIGDKSSCTGREILGTCIRVPKGCPIVFDWVCGCRPNKANPGKPVLKWFPSNCVRQKAGYWLMLNDSCPR